MSDTSNYIHSSGHGPNDDLFKVVPATIIDEVGLLMLPDATIDRMMEVMEREMKCGMSKDKNIRNKSSLQMENTYVRDVLDGSEEGDFLALDLGGTNFRILHAVMEDGKLVYCKSRNYNLSADILCGPCIGVFDHLAESIGHFLQAEDIQDKKLPLGFTFSFPMHQEGLRKGILVTWTKSFKCPDGVGQDAVHLLEEAIKRKGGFNVDIVAILNDTTGTLMAGAYVDHKCQIGMILGTGSNVSYVEHLENVDKWTGPIADPKQVIIDVEWGAFGDNGSLDFLKADCDWLVDQHSNHVGSFTFEKYFGGMYMGEIVRCIIQKYVKRGVLFSGKLSEKLQKHWSFTSKYVTSIESDVDNLENTKHVLAELDLLDVAAPSDIASVRFICELVSIRAAQIISAGLAVLLHHIKKPEVTIAVDGSLFKYHPTLKNMMQHDLDNMVPDTKSKLILADDGSGRGAAFVAAVAARMKKEKN